MRDLCQLTCSRWFSYYCSSPATNSPIQTAAADCVLKLSPPDFIDLHYFACKNQTDEKKKSGRFFFSNFIAAQDFYVCEQDAKVSSGKQRHAWRSWRLHSVRVKTCKVSVEHTVVMRLLSFSHHQLLLYSPVLHSIFFPSSYFVSHLYSCNPSLSHHKWPWLPATSL